MWALLQNGTSVMSPVEAPGVKRITQNVLWSDSKMILMGAVFSKH